MIKQYTDKDYADKAVEANSKGLSLYILVTPTEFSGTDEQGQIYTYTDDVATLITAKQGYYVTYNGNYTNGAINENFEQEQAQKEAQRIAMLNLTGADVERAIYKAKGMDFDDIITFLEAQPLSEEGQPVVDIKALKIELKANNFYRGNPYIDTIGTLLGFTKQQLDEFFETNDYTKLIS